ncbi:MAG: sterol desaturase family protein [Bacteroidota bacterium]
MKKLYVSNKDESVRMFKSDVLESLSKVHFSVPLILYIPLIVYSLYLASQQPDLSLLAGIGFFAGGVLLWSLVEYLLHRYIFHYVPKSSWGLRMHFIFHGVHHDYPNDSKRLVMPPSVSLPLAVLFYFIFWSIFPEVYLHASFAGFVLGYLIYDMLHYAIHHVEMKGKWWIALKTHHLKHHFKDPDKGYGVSSPFWDEIVGSNFRKGNEKRRSDRKKSNIHSKAV